MKIFEKKRLGLSCLALVAAIVIGVCVGTGCGEKAPDPTEGTSNVGDPTGTTGGNGNEVTDPSDNTDSPLLPDGPEVPSVPEGTEPGEAKPTDPSEPQKPDDDIEPTEPDATIPDPTEPDGGDEDEVAPTVPTPTPTPTPNPEPEYDFTGITPGNLTAEQWKSWDRAKRQAFHDTYDIANLSLDDKYNFYLQTQFDGYDCGFEGHHCAAQDHHDQIMTEMAAGCPHCGGNDCAAFYARNMMGFTQIDFSACPQYDITKDPVYYCQDCGLSLGGGNAQSGDECCHKYIADATCSWCGEPVKANECHRCIKP